MEKYELEPFEICVQSLSRTLVDKTYAICDYYLSNKCSKHSRHIYDISKLLDVVPLDKELDDLYLAVRNMRQKIDICYSAKENVKLYNLIEQIIDSNYFEKDYITLTSQLLYDDYDYKTCHESLIKLQMYLKSHNL